MQSTMQQEWEKILRLINDRFPILVRSGDSPVRERVQEARLTPLNGNGTYQLELVTYRGKLFQFQPIVGAELKFLELDKQGVPVEYELVLKLQTNGGADSAEESLRFYA